MGGTDVDIAAPPGAGAAPAGELTAQRSRIVTAGAYAGAGVVLFLVYLRLSMTEGLNSDSANILLMGWDMLHGHVLLPGWYASDVSFWSTEIPQYALLTGIFGLHAQTAHIAAAMTYTLVFLLAVAVARAGASSPRNALARTLIAGGIMLAPQLGLGVFAMVLSVGHIGTAVPLLLTWLLVDRAERTGIRRWYVPVVAAVLLAWVEIADPIVLILGIAPLTLAAAIRAVQHRDLWLYYLGLAAAGPAAYGGGWVAEQVLRALGGYQTNALPFYLTPRRDLSHNAPAAWKVLEVFGANFAGLQGTQLVLAFLHLASVIVVGAAMLIAQARFFRPSRAGHDGRGLIDQILLIAITVNIALFFFTNAANLAAHEVAIIVPFGAILAARQLTTLQPPTARVRVGAAAAGLAVLAGYTAGLAYDISQPAVPMQNTSLASWLAAHHLTYGLGGYWTSSSVTIDSGNTVQVRALMQYTMHDNLWMSDKAWYDPKLHYANFIVLDSQVGYFTHWEPVALIHQYFGSPAKIYQAGQYSIWVWNHNLLPEIPGNT
jgi:hypothetical protein